jgi:hypothetical protein
LNMRSGLWLCVLAVVALAVGFAGVAQADMVGNDPSGDTSAKSAHDVQVVAGQLHGTGMNDAELAVRISAMTRDEMAFFAANPQQVSIAKGDNEGNVLMVIGAFVVLVILPLFLGLFVFGDSN